MTNNLWNPTDYAKHIAVSQTTAKVNLSHGGASGWEWRYIPDTRQQVCALQMTSAAIFPSAAPNTLPVSWATTIYANLTPFPATIQYGSILTGTKRLRIIRRRVYNRQKLRDDKTNCALTFIAPSETIAMQITRELLRQSGKAAGMLCAFQGFDAQHGGKKTRQKRKLLFIGDLLYCCHWVS